MVRVEMSNGEVIDVEGSIVEVGDHLNDRFDNIRFAAFKKLDGKRIVLVINEIHTITEL